MIGASGTGMTGIEEAVEVLDETVTVLVIEVEEASGTEAETMTGSLDPMIVRGI